MSQRKQQRITLEPLIEADFAAVAEMRGVPVTKICSEATAFYWRSEVFQQQLEMSRSRKDLDQS